MFLIIRFPNSDTILNVVEMILSLWNNYYSIMIVSFFNVCFRSVKSILFQHCVEFLIKAELRHVNYCERWSICISGNQSFSSDYISYIERIINECGTIEHCQFFEGITEYGVIREVVYAFAFQAIIAMLLINDIFFGSSGHISVDLKCNAKMKAIIQFTKEDVINHISLVYE